VADRLTRERQADGHVAEEAIRRMPDEGQRQRRCDSHDGARWQRDPSIVREPEDSLLPVMRRLTRGFTLANGTASTAGRSSQHGQTEQQQQKTFSLRHPALFELSQRNTC